jgi:hypothetical protein
MPKRSSLVLLFLSLLIAATLSAQALLPEEIQEPGPHRLQLKYLSQLRAIGSAIESHKFPYAFYFSRSLDITEQQQVKLDQRSIRFERFQGQTVLAITGNYFAAYSGELMNKNARAQKTLEDVVLPMMQIAVPYFADDDTFDGYAIEVSHHVRRKMAGISSENAENVMYFFPRAAGQHLVNAKAPDALQGALLESKIFIDAEPFNLWVNGVRPSDQPESMPGSAWKEETRPQPASEVSVQPTVSQKLMRPVTPPRILTPKVLENLNIEYAAQIKRLETDLGDQVHFAGYTPTQFIGFHEAAYLQMSVMYEVKAPADASRYKLVALAFDEHVSHLIRPVCAHFQDTSDFDGIVFSLIIKPKGTDTSLAAEFYLPISAMRNFGRYDASGQDLLDSGYVLINGERAMVNLQLAEGK